MHILDLSHTLEPNMPRFAGFDADGNRTTDAINGYAGFHFQVHVCARVRDAGHAHGDSGLPFQIPAL